MLIKFVTNRKLLNDEDEFLSVLELICEDLKDGLKKRSQYRFCNTQGKRS